ncbi:FKBP-type peptidyl-prolyl cis-trans isomerase [Rubricoccus marinus]|uniref:Peptidyl-prolyl cis-trans isomerase n=1 Tax=Rubricoccus marinus TaxID=716817 RepID=A0A259TXC3_9BACT|nr:FKBP-type peptidyl-prolyl cis-trans isomerase [Rubricoccus marinus]OZC02346.1 hypothetical protein BSZ36_04755 [Rubricoccus marinus]
MPRLFAAALFAAAALCAASGVRAQERLDLSTLDTVGELTYVLGFDAAKNVQQDSASFAYFTYDTFASGFQDGAAGDSSRLAYMYGYEIGSRVGSDTTLSMSPDLFLASFREGLAFPASQLDDAQKRSVMNQVQDMLFMNVLRERAQDEPEAQQKLAQIEAGAREADSLLTAAAQRPGAEVRASGLVVIPGTEGTGPEATMTDRVLVRYTGTLADGTEFDASGEEPAQFALRGVVPGFGEGVSGMKAGGTRTLVIPPSLAYGLQGTNGGPIGPNKALTFEVELVEIVAPTPAPGLE